MKKIKKIIKIIWYVVRNIIKIMVKDLPISSSNEGYQPTQLQIVKLANNSWKINKGIKR